MLKQQILKSETKSLQTRLAALRSRVLETVLEAEQREKTQSLAREKAMRDNFLKKNMYA